MFEVYGRGGELIYTTSERSTALRAFHQWPGTEYVREVVKTHKIIAIKEGTVHEALEQEAENPLEPSRDLAEQVQGTRGSVRDVPEEG